MLCISPSYLRKCRAIYVVHVIFLSVCMTYTYSHISAMAYSMYLIFAGPSQVINLMASPASITDILVTWQRPIASGTMENTLSYNISINDSFVELLDNSTTMYLITSRTPGVSYTIQVCGCVCVV